MKHLQFYSSIITLVSIFLLLSCSKNDDVQYPPIEVVILTNAYQGDTLKHNLTIEAGHRQMPNIIFSAHHADLSSLFKDPLNDNYIYTYKPVVGFIGQDSIVFRSVEPVEKQTLTSHFIITVRQ